LGGKPDSGRGLPFSCCLEDAETTRGEGGVKRFSLRTIIRLRRKDDG